MQQFLYIVSFSLLIYSVKWKKKILTVFNKIIVLNKISFKLAKDLGAYWIVFHKKMNLIKERNYFTAFKCRHSLMRTPLASGIKDNVL